MHQELTALQQEKIVRLLMAWIRQETEVSGDKTDAQ